MDMCIDMCVDMCIDMCVVMCIDTMCVHMGIVLPIDCRRWLHATVQLPTRVTCEHAVHVFTRAYRAVTRAVMRCMRLCMCPCSACDHI